LHEHSPLALALPAPPLPVPPILFDIVHRANTTSQHKPCRLHPQPRRARSTPSISSWTSSSRTTSSCASARSSA
jgi:hypothetical protein